MMEFCHGVEQFPQPQPHRLEGGDCFACALVAWGRWAFPSDPPTFDRVWECFLKDGEIACSWPMYRAALYKLQGHGYRFELQHELVQPQFDSKQNHSPWYRDRSLTRRIMHRLEGWFRSGWVAYAPIAYDGSGPYLPGGEENETDHVVLLDGVREVLADRAYVPEVHVVCSASGCSWRPIDKMVRLHGMADMFMLRRRDA
jgi:hypothetical protein